MDAPEKLSANEDFFFSLKIKIIIFDQTNASLPVIVTLNYVTLIVTLIVTENSTGKSKFIATTMNN